MVANVAVRNVKTLNCLPHSLLTYLPNEVQSKKFTVTIPYNLLGPL